MNYTFKQLRKRENLTCEEIAAALHISESAYRKYEISARIPQLKTLVVLKQLYKCTDEELMGAVKYHTSKRKNG